MVLVFKNCLGNTAELGKGENAVKGRASTSLCAAAGGESKMDMEPVIKEGFSLFLDIQMRH